jgi:hypothetical protein
MAGADLQIEESLAHHLGFGSLRNGDGRNWDDLSRQSVRHELRHSMRLRAINVAVSVENEFPAVFVALPFGNDLYIDAAFDCASDEHPPK